MEPIFELSARGQLKGGPIQANELPPLLAGQQKLTILIHGFNNDWDQASRSYAKFLRSTGLRQYSLLTGRICTFFWPGDHGWYRYHEEIPHALEAAEVLREYVRSIAAGQPIEVSLICHSLGNRLALEFVRESLADGLRVEIPRACLMAAAVPVEKIEEGPLRNAAEEIVQRHVLFSESDLALGIVFQVGQELASQLAPEFADELTADAVGKHGAPEGFWRDAVDMTPYAHGDYWWESESAAEARYLFGIATVRLIPQRRTLSRVLSTISGLPARSVADRKIFPGIRGD